MESSIKLIISILLWVVATPAISQRLSHIQYPCDDAPEDSVLTVPESVSHLVQVQCTVYGHVVTGTSEHPLNYISQHGDGTYSAYVSAQPVRRDESRQLHLVERYDKDYFVRIETSHLDQEQARALALALALAELVTIKTARLNPEGAGMFSGGMDFVVGADVLHLVANYYDEERERFFEHGFNVYIFSHPLYYTFSYPPHVQEPEIPVHITFRMTYIDSQYFHNWSGATSLSVDHLYAVDEVEAVELEQAGQ